MINLIDSFKGEIAALTAAFFWTISSIIYANLGQNFSPLQLNFSKGIVAIILLILTLTIQNQTLPEFSLIPVSFLLLSGVIGITLGDTAIFAALNQLGARQTLIIQTIAPPLAAILALIFLAEKLSITSWCGILLTLIGVTWVISEGISTSVSQENHTLWGIFWAILAAISQASGAVFSRFALIESNLTPLWATLLRLLAANLIILLLLLNPRQNNSQLSQKMPIILSLKLIGLIILTAFFSTYLGIWLQQISLKFASAGISQTLSATSPLFVLPIVFFLGEKVSLRAVLGVLISLLGIGILFLGRI